MNHIELQGIRVPALSVSELLPGQSRGCFQLPEHALGQRRGRILRIICQTSVSGTPNTN